jgi:hypothetical protein
MESRPNTSSSVEYDYGLIMVIKSLRGVGRERERLFNVQIAERQWRIGAIDTLKHNIWQRLISQQFVRSEVYYVRKSASL